MNSSTRYTHGVKLDLIRVVESISYMAERGGFYYDLNR